jgi:hypothetical protein
MARAIRTQTRPRTAAVPQRYEHSQDAAALPAPNDFPEPRERTGADEMPLPQQAAHHA